MVRKRAQNENNGKNSDSVNFRDIEHVYEMFQSFKSHNGRKNA